MIKTKEYRMASIHELELIERLKKELGLGADRKFYFLLVGRTGVGKSSTVNSLLGQDMAKVGHYEATTMAVEEYESTINGIKFGLMDTPGLCDDMEEVGNDEKYIQMMRTKIKSVDSLWYVTRLDDTRVTSDEKRGIKILSDAMGSKVWNNGVIVFTFSNNIDPKNYAEALSQRTELLRREIAKYAPREAAKIPSVAVDNNKLTTPDGKEWLGELFTKVLSQISKEGAAPFYIAMARDLRPKKDDSSAHPQKPRIVLDERQREEVKKTIDAKIIPALAIAGATIGAVLGPVGSAVGGAVGSAIGVISWLWS